MTGPDRPRLIVRRATPADLDGIMAIERVSFPTPWTESTMLRELTDARTGTYLAAEVDGQVAAYVGAWVYSGEAHVLNLATAPEHRDRGLGEILMLAILDEATRAGCDVALLEYRVTNLPAEALYRKLGFLVVGHRPRYYFDTGEDAALATLADLQTPERQSFLAHCREVWEQKHGWAVEFA
jgi:ribosomal-protein-alanine N-acetyltransferase